SSAYFDWSAGVVREFLLRSEFGPREEMDAAKAPAFLPCALVLSKPDGSGRFSDDTRVIVGKNEEYLLADPGDATLWRLNLADFSKPMSRLELPDGDRFTGFVYRADRKYSRRSVVQAMEPLVRGERGTYDFAQGVMVRYDPTRDPTHVLFEDAGEL